MTSRVVRAGPWTCSGCRTDLMLLLKAYVGPHPVTSARCHCGTEVNVPGPLVGLYENQDGVWVRIDPALQPGEISTAEPKDFEFSTDASGRSWRLIT
jgi:hypothetical protein